MSGHITLLRDGEHHPERENDGEEYRQQGERMPCEPQGGRSEEDRGSKHQVTRWKAALDDVAELLQFELDGHQEDRQQVQAKSDSEAIGAEWPTGRGLRGRR